MTYGVINWQGKIIGKLSTTDATRLDDTCKSLEGYTEWQLVNSNLFTWDFTNGVWVIGEFDEFARTWTPNKFPPEPPPIDPNQQWHDQLAIAGFTEDQIKRIIAIG